MSRSISQRQRNPRRMITDYSTEISNHIYILAKNRSLLPCRGLLRDLTAGARAHHRPAHCLACELAMVTRSWDQGLVSCWHIMRRRVQESCGVQANDGRRLALAMTKKKMLAFDISKSDGYRNIAVFDIWSPSIIAHRPGLAWPNQATKRIPLVLDVLDVL